jgi:hypothetical protein
VFTTSRLFTPVSRNAIFPENCVTFSSLSGETVILGTGVNRSLLVADGWVGGKKVEG